MLIILYSKYINEVVSYSVSNQKQLSEKMTGEISLVPFSLNFPQIPSFITIYM